ncbi:hypothetical protein [Dongia sp.]|uniref:hypothetical protein n=1 Tax=Dongia sp. TaxID=1977262 RepID=UPI0035B3331C
MLLSANTRPLLSGLAALAAALLINPLAVGPARADNPDLPACLDFERAACDAVLRTEPDNLTALFLRGLASELAGDEQAALADFDATATREPRHFGAQLWRQVAAASLQQDRRALLEAYLAGAKQLAPWPRVLAELYLGKADAGAVLQLAEGQPATARAEAICAAEYHIGRALALSGDMEAAKVHFGRALATGAEHVFEYRAAERALH